MSNNPYRDYYEAISRDDEWSGVDAEKARQRIKTIREIASWNGISEEEAFNSMDEMGG